MGFCFSTIPSVVTKPTRGAPRSPLRRPRRPDSQWRNINNIVKSPRDVTKMLGKSWATHFVSKNRLLIHTQYTMATSHPTYARSRSFPECAGPQALFLFEKRYNLELGPIRFNWAMDPFNIFRSWGNWIGVFLESQPPPPNSRYGKRQKLKRILRER